MSMLKMDKLRQGSPYPQIRADATYYVDKKISQHDGDMLLKSAKDTLAKGKKKQLVYFIEVPEAVGWSTLIVTVIRTVTDVLDYYPELVVTWYELRVNGFNEEYSKDEDRPATWSKKGVWFQIRLFGLKDI